MNDMGFMDRESKKRQLRRNIVQPPQEERPSRYEEEYSEEVIRQVHRETVSYTHLTLPTILLV